MLRPSIAQARAAGGIDILEISAFDTESGVVPGSLTVTCNLRLGAFAPGANLAAGKPIDPKGSVLRLVLPRRVRLDERRRLHRERAGRGGTGGAGGADVQGCAAGCAMIVRSVSPQSGNTECVPKGQKG